MVVECNAPEVLVAYHTQSQVGLVANISFLTVGLNGKIVAQIGTSLRPRDAASLEKRLKDNLNDDLKQKLFGPSKTTNGSTKMIERNACGQLLFNTLADMGNSENYESAAVLKLALDERKDDAPFLAAVQSLASSSEIMAFVNFLFGKDNAPQLEASNADESRQSTGLETSGATTITETSGPTSRAGTSVSDSEGFFKATTRNKVKELKNTSMLIVLTALHWRLMCLQQRNKSDHKKSFEHLKLQQQF